MWAESPTHRDIVLSVTVDSFSSMNLWLGFLPISISCYSNHLIYFSEDLNYYKCCQKSTKLLTLNIEWPTLICWRGSNNTGSYKISGHLYFSSYMSSCTTVSVLNSYVYCNLQVDLWWRCTTKQWIIHLDLEG